MDLLGELGAFMYRPRLLLSSPLGRVEALAVPFSMLLDVLVLGHSCLVGAAAAAYEVASRSPLSRCSRLLSQRPHGERWLRLPLEHAYAMAVATSEVACMRMRPRVGREQRATR